MHGSAINPFCRKAGISDDLGLSGKAIESLPDLAAQLAAAVAEIDRLTNALVERQAHYADAVARSEGAEASRDHFRVGYNRSRYVGGHEAIDVNETQTFGGRRTLRQMGDASDGGE